jgi:hypothetical protein
MLVKLSFNRGTSGDFCSQMARLRMRPDIRHWQGATSPPPGVCSVSITPLQQTDQDQVELRLVLTGEVIFGGWRVRLVLTLVDHAVLDQWLQPIRWASGTVA